MDGAPCAPVVADPAAGTNGCPQAGIAEVEKAYPATVPFVQAEENSTPTDYTPAWSYIETGVLHVIGQEAQQLATGQPYSASYVLGQLQAENSVVQAHLSSS